jgi:hypothetical protein
MITSLKGAKGKGTGGADTRNKSKDFEDSSQLMVLDESSLIYKSF